MNEQQQKLRNLLKAEVDPVLKALFDLFGN